LVAVVVVVMSELVVIGHPVQFIERYHNSARKVLITQI
jgi:hypothetical protein